MTSSQPLDRGFAFKRKPWHKGLLILLGYVVLTVAFTRPLAWRATDGYIANIADNGDGSYNFNPYQLQNCLQNGTSCTYTHLQCYPHGNSLTLNTNMPLPSLLSQPWSNTTTGLNIVLLLECILMGLGGWLFARLFLKSDWLAFIAGALGTFWMGRSAHLWYGHANLMFAASLPFALYALHRTLPRIFQAERFTEFRVGWAAFFVGLAGITILHDLILGGFLVIYGVILVLLIAYRLLLQPRKWYWRVLVLFGLLMVVDQGAQWLLRWKFSDNAAFYYSGSFKNLIYPHPVSQLYNVLFFKQEIHMAPIPGFDIGRVMFAGYGFILLSIVLVVYRLRKRRKLALPWLLVVCVLGLLYTMPLLRWGNGRLLYGPFALTHFIPMWNENRCPTRFMDLLMIIGPIWVFANLDDLPLWRHFKKGTKAALCLTLLLLMLAEHLPREFKFADLKHGPAIYPALAASADPGVLFVPFGLVDGKKAFGSLWLEPLAYLPVHRRMMNNGYLSRIDEDCWDFFERDSFMVRLVRNQFWNPDVGYPSDTVDTCAYATLDPADVQASLKLFDIRQVVIRPDYELEPAYVYLIQSLQPFILRDTTFDEGHRWLQLKWVE
jgi:hypothetical protein